MILRAPAAVDRPHLETCSCDTCHQRAAEAELRATISLILAGFVVGVLLVAIHGLVTAGPGLRVMVGL